MFAKNTTSQEKLYNMKKNLPFLEYLKNNNGYLDCPACKERLFKIKLPKLKMDIIKAKDFVPVSDKITKPTKGENIKCPLCSTVLVYDYKEHPSQGSIYK